MATQIWRRICRSIVRIERLCTDDESREVQPGRSWLPLAICTGALPIRRSSLRSSPKGICSARRKKKRKRQKTSYEGQRRSRALPSCRWATMWCMRTTAWVFYRGIEKIERDGGHQGLPEGGIWGQRKPVSSGYPPGWHPEVCVALTRRHRS